MPLFLWSMYATSIIMVLGTPVLAITIFLLALEHLFHVGIFSPALGGDPLLFQHCSGSIRIPAVYIMILPAHGSGQRNHRLLLRESAYSATSSSRFRAWPSPSWAFWSGDTTCSSPGNRSTRA